jgi:hypothetical protein
MGARLKEVLRLGPLLACAWLALAPPLAAQKPPARRALLIGINDYSSPSVTDLRGAVNDVTMIRRILTTRFGLAERDVTVLVDAQATRKGILAALERLVGEAGTDDVVYIHFSGHGSQVEDLNGDEQADHMDETILPHDAREPGVPDIIDDEFERLFARLRSRHALIVLDSCHSGTGTRDPTPVQPRSVAPDRRVDVYRQFSTRSRDVVTVEQLPHVLMTGAPAGQQALDGPVEGGWYGLFSHSLAASLDALGPTATPIELHDRTVQELRRVEAQLFTTAPDPQLEAPEDRLRVPFASTAAAAPASAPARRTWLAIEPLDGDHVRLVGGVDLNAQPGSLWALYAAEESEFEFGNAIALGRVERVQGRDAVLALQVRRGALPQGARAIALAPRDESGSVPVRIDASEERRARLQRALMAALPEVTFVGKDDPARFVVALEGAVWRVKDAGGLQTALSFPDATDETLARALAQVFSTSATAIALLSLENPAASIRVAVDVVSDEAGRGQQPASQARPAVRIRTAADARSEHNSLMLEIRANRDAYLTIVDVDTEGGVNLLFPNDYQRQEFLPEGLVRANAVTRIPDSFIESNRAGFHWDYTPPAGRDTVRVFAAADLQTAQRIRSLAGQAGRRREAIGELRSALAASGVRGVGVVAAGGAPGGLSNQSGTADGTHDWAAASVVIDVRN